MRNATSLLLLFSFCAGAFGLTAACSGSDGGSVEPSSTDAGSTDAPAYDAAPEDANKGPVPIPPGKSELALKVGERQRNYVLVAPPSVATKKLPLVIALHGNGDTSSAFITATTKLESLATEKGFVLAAPQGVSQSLTVTTQGGTQTLDVAWDAYRTVEQGNIDLPFLDALRAALVATGSIDEKHVFTVGYSQGGFMSFRYGMENAEAMSCAAVLAAANPMPGSPLVGSAKRKIAVALQIGANDPSIDAARATKKELDDASFPLDYHEIDGAGHGPPPPGDLSVPLDYCLGQAAP